MVALYLNRPRAANRVSQLMAEELALAALHINQDDSSRVVTLTGSGDVFSVGWELPRGVASPDALSLAASAVASVQKPVVVAINGNAIGQGLELVLAGDIRIAATTARFAMPQARYGLLPWDGGTQRLSRLIGRAHALELLLMGDEIDAAAALRMGLVNRVAAPEALPRMVEEVVEQVLSGAPVALRYAKEAVWGGNEMTLSQGLRLEADLTMLLQSTKDRTEGIRSFAERRSAVFRGE